MVGFEHMSLINAVIYLHSAKQNIDTIAFMGRAGNPELKFVKIKKYFFRFGHWLTVFLLLITQDAHLRLYSWLI